MELPQRARPWRSPAALLPLLSCALLCALAALAALAALLLLRPAGGPAPQQPQRGVRLVLRGPGRTMKSGKLEWFADNSIDGVSLGPGFEYDPTSHMLKIKNPGLYYIYARLSAKYVFKGSCKEEGNATLTVHRRTSHGSVPILTLPLPLTSSSNNSLSAFAVVSSYQLAEGDFLYAMLTVSNHAGLCEPTQWYFDDGTVFGLSHRFWEL